MGAASKQNCVTISPSSPPLLKGRELRHQIIFELVLIDLGMPVRKSGQMHAHDAILFEYTAFDHGKGVGHRALRRRDVAAHQHDLVCACLCAQDRQMLVDLLECREVPRRQMRNGREPLGPHLSCGGLEFLQGKIGQRGEKEGRSCWKQAPAPRSRLP